jgi:hypothetical protein
MVILKTAVVTGLGDDNLYETFAKCDLKKVGGKNTRLINYTFLLQNVVLNTCSMFVLDNKTLFFIQLKNVRNQKIIRLCNFLKLRM